jgi:chloramphenicol-sensitive protein RarD
MNTTADPSPSPAAASASTLGVAFALGAFVQWGLLPLYWSLLDALAPAEILAWRMIFTTVLLLGVIALRGELAGFARLLVNARMMAALGASAVFIAGNWFGYIWAVSQDQVLEISLGYYINPLVNVLLGFLVLRERFTALQGTAIALAVLGVANMAWGAGADFPWISLVLAFSFGFYGLIRKLAVVDAVQGLAVETLLVVPLSLAALLWFAEATGLAAPGLPLWLFLVLVASGLVTAAPLFCYVNAAKRLRYATIGIISYLAPSIQFLLGVTVYERPFTTTHMITFALIWSACALYSAEAWRLQRRARRFVRMPAE